MASQKEEARQNIAERVARFQALTPAQLRTYHEANTKSAFVEPLFAALGWNVSDANEVAREERASGGAVDYAFKIRGVSRFYLEAKPLREDLNNPEWVKKTITYAYNKGVPWAVLTNFQNLQVFCAHAQDLARARALNLTCQDYLAAFDTLWLLSKDAISSDALDRQATKWGLPPRLPIEKRLFGQLRQWRARLFTYLYRYEHDNHLKLSFDQVDETILRLFNRLIFIRNAEDRRLEERKLLAALHEWQSSGRRDILLGRLREVFRYYDGYYDSDLFTLHLADQAFVQDDLLEEVIGGLYDLPGGLASYDFSILDADVLGAVYEQYLGHVAAEVKERAEKQERQLALGIVPEESVFDITAKKQKRKGQGIYYTPRWVVDYIVEQTVGRFIKEHTYDEIFNMKILDPACGSGSFLIRAYQTLLDYHAKVRGKTTAELSMWERLSVLLNNIYGVDLDPQAVEIARLNLLLRAVAQRESLPSLADNIKVGNSLISGDEGELRQYFGDGWEHKRPFAWQKEFPAIMAQGGFDVVIGNPPYVGFHGFAEDKSFFRQHYNCATGRFDLYMPFIERGLQLLREGGVLGFICPTNFMKREHGATLRKLLRDDCQIAAIVDFEHGQVFEEATNYTCTLVLTKRRPEDNLVTYYPGGLDRDPYKIKQSELSPSGWVFVPPNQQDLVQRIKARSVMALGDIAEGIYEGVVTGQNAVFMVPAVVASKHGLEKRLIRPAIQGKHVERYFLEKLTHVLIYPYKPDGDTSVPVDEGELQAQCPNVYQYLTQRRSQLSGRKYFDDSGKAWYEIWNERSFGKQAVRKIVCQEIAAGSKFALSTDEEFYLDTVCGIVLRDKGRSPLLYVLGLLNCRLLEYYYKRTTVPKAGGFYIYKTMFLKPLPIRRIDFANPGEKQMHDSLVALVERMLDLHQRLAQKGNIRDQEREGLVREIERTDRDIDELVYDLYGLTAEERQLVEAETQRPTK